MAERSSNNLNADPRYSTTLLRGLRILELIGATSQGATVADLIAGLQLGRGTTYRLVRTMERAGWTRRTSGGRYVISSGVVQVAAHALEAFDLRATVHPVLVWMRDQSGETAHLGVLQGDRVMYLDKVDTPQVLRMHTAIGSVMPAHSTALGKAMLAYSPEPIVDRVLGGELEGRTPHTVTSAADLRKQLGAIRETGIAVDDMENEPHIRCVGAPVFAHDGSVIAAMSISAPASRFTRDLIPKYGLLVRQGARQVTRLIGGGDGLDAVDQVPTSRSGREDGMATRAKGGLPALSLLEDV